MAPYGVDEPQPKSSARMTTMLGFALCAAGAVENAARKTVIQTERNFTKEKTVEELLNEGAGWRG